MAGAGLILAMLASATAAEKPASIRSAAELGAKWGVVTSVLRTPERNRLVGGVPNSFHLAGQAVDIARRSGVRHADIEAAFRKAGYVLIESLDEGDHSHFAFQLHGTGGVARMKPQQPSRTEVVQVAACTPAPEATLAVRRRPDRVDGCAGSGGASSASDRLSWANEQIGAADRTLNP